MTARVGIAHASPSKYTHPKAVMRRAIAGVRDTSQRIASMPAPATSTAGSINVRAMNAKHTMGIVINRRDHA
jgi:hypothetical protein